MTLGNDQAVTRRDGKAIANPECMGVLTQDALGRQGAEGTSLVSQRCYPTRRRNDAR